MARNARCKTNISGISGHFCKLANYGVINPPSRPPRGMHLATPARLGGRKSGLRRNPGMGARCAKTQYGKLGALQYCYQYTTGVRPPRVIPLIDRRLADAPTDSQRCRSFRCEPKFFELAAARFGAAMSCSSGLCLRRFLGGSLRPAARRYGMSWFAGPPQGADVRR